MSGPDSASGSASGSVRVGFVGVGERDPVVVVTLGGEIDLACVPDLLAAAEQIRSLPPSAFRNAVVVDLSAATFLGLVGVEFLEVLERAAAPGGLVVVGASAHVCRLLALLGLERMVLEPLASAH